MWFCWTKLTTVWSWQSSYSPPPGWLGNHQTSEVIMQFSWRFFWLSFHATGDFKLETEMKANKCNSPKRRQRIGSSSAAKPQLKLFIIIYYPKLNQEMIIEDKKLGNRWSGNWSVVYLPDVSFSCNLYLELKSSFLLSSSVISLGWRSELLMFIKDWNNFF